MKASRVLVFGLTLAWAALLSSAVGAQPAHEAAPVLKAGELLPPALLKGPRFTVADQVPVQGLLGRFTLQSDFGKFDAAGIEMLRIREAEVAALATLEQTSKTDEFLKAAGTAAARPVKAGAHMIMNPVETVKGVPTGVSRFYDRLKTGTQYVTAGTSDASKSDAEKAEDVSKRVGSVTIDVLGWEEERRALAKRLGVDPYTTNTVLSEKLSDYAWVTFSGRVGLNAVVSVVMPMSMIMTATSVTNDMVWDLKPADVIKADREKLKALGATDAAIDALTKNPWYSVTTLTWLTNGLAALEGVVGRADVVEFAAGARTEAEARFIAAAVNMLTAVHTTTPLATVSPHGTVVGRTQGGAVFVPAPVDYIAWTEGVATFARRADLQARERTLVTTGRRSPRAAKELTSQGWNVNEVAPLTPPAVALPTTSR
jgi:hypothetical protein